jgi:hypothetical protein
MLIRGSVLAAVLATGCTRDIYYGTTTLEIDTPANPPDLSNPLIEDVFRQRIPEKVDILWVIDNSQSMLAEQEKLAANFNSFLLYYRESGLDWQIGVVSTDMQDGTQSGRLQGAAGFLWTDPTVPDPVGVFRQMALLGRDGAPKEQGLAAARAALSEPLVSGSNAGFYRDDALLSIIVVSDENDFSDALTPVEFVGWLGTLKPDPEMVDFSAIIGVDTECTDRAGDDYLSVIDMVGGTAYSICERDWTPILEALGIRAAGLQREFVLTQVPDVDTLSVWIEDEGVEYTFERDVDYTYDGDNNSIIFQRYTPRATAFIHLAYEILR